jgi:hypothetical protein
MPSAALIGGFSGLANKKTVTLQPGSGREIVLVL